jgi:hypothetical protein
MLRSVTQRVNVLAKSAHALRAVRCWRYDRQPSRHWISPDISIGTSKKLGA